MIRLLAFAIAAALSLIPDASATPPRSDAFPRRPRALPEASRIVYADFVGANPRGNTTARRAFQRENPCPVTGLPTACPGYQSIT